MKPVDDNGAAGLPIVAAIDAGTNSVHLLVATATGSHLRVIADDKVYLRLGQAIESGRLGAQRADLITALLRFSQAARDLGAERVALIGTEPLRRAADAVQVARDVERAAGSRLAVLSHAEEGLLTTLGVTLGAPIERSLLVADVGGGSSELVLAIPGRAPIAVGLRLGTARLMAGHASHDPPARVEVEAMRAAAARVLEDAPAAEAAEVVVVGGAVSNLLRVVVEAGTDGWLDRTRVESAIGVLTAEPAAAVAERFGIHPVRAHTLPAGAAVLQALLGRYQVTRVRISDASLREGAIIALLRAGDGWREALPSLVGGAPAAGIATGP